MGRAKRWGVVRKVLKDAWRAGEAGSRRGVSVGRFGMRVRRGVGTLACDPGLHG